MSDVTVTPTAVSVTVAPSTVSVTTSGVAAGAGLAGTNVLTWSNTFNG